jgi:hypothetical protein
VAADTGYSNSDADLYVKQLCTQLQATADGVLVLLPEQLLFGGVRKAGGDNKLMEE